LNEYFLLRVLRESNWNFTKTLRPSLQSWTVNP
jgi:hypothetical protein